MYTIYIGDEIEVIGESITLYLKKQKKGKFWG